MSIFYRASFCAECGNRFARRRWQFPACFCRQCAHRVLPSRYTLLLGFAAACILSGFALGVRLRDNPPERLTIVGSPVIAPTPLVSALDARGEMRAPVEANVAYAICGARTKRGTPCRHRVLEGQRCAQHQGLPSMIDSSIKQMRKND
jgi:hypothetical protein